MKFYKIIILLFMIFLLTTGFGYKLSLRKILNEYEEECIKYKFVAVNESYKWCNSTFMYLLWCDTPFCNCPNIETSNRIVYKKTNECIKYHLVRKV